MRAISREALEVLSAHDWPGNVRELENFVRRLVVVGDVARAREELASRIAAARQRGLLDAPASREGTRSPLLGPAASTRVGESLDLKAIARRAAREAERAALLEAIERVRWNRAAAARILKVSYKTLLNKLTECGITPGQPGPQA